MPGEFTLSDSIRQILELEADKRPTTATVHGIDGVHADIMLTGSVAVVRHVEVIGNINNVAVGDTVQIAWGHDNRPVVMLIGSGGAGTSIASVVADNQSIENSDSGLRVKAAGILRHHLGFTLPDESEFIDAFTAAGWRIDPDTGNIYHSGIVITSGGMISLGSGEEVIKMSGTGVPDRPDSPEDDTEYRLWIGRTDPTFAPFAVDKYGHVILRGGTVGGWSLDKDDIISDAGNARIHSGARPYIGLGTDYYGGTGFWAGKDTDYIYKVSVGEAGGPQLTYDGTDLTLQDIDLKFYYGTNFTLWIQSDGDFAIGADIDTVSSTSLRIFSNDQTYDGEAFTAGDIIIGDHGGAHMTWDQSEGQLQFRDGSETGVPVRAYIDTDGSIMFGDGQGRLDDTGFVLEASADRTEEYYWNSVNWVDGLGTTGETLRARLSGASYEMWMRIPSSSGRISLGVDSDEPGSGTAWQMVYGVNGGEFWTWSYNDDLDGVMTGGTIRNVMLAGPFTSAPQSGFGHRTAWYLQDGASSFSQAAYLDVIWEEGWGGGEPSSAFVFHAHPDASMVELVRIGSGPTSTATPEDPYALLVNPDFHSEGNFAVRGSGGGLPTLIETDAGTNEIFIYQAMQIKTSGAPTPDTGWGTLYHYSVDNKLYWYDGATYYDLTSGGATYWNAVDTNTIYTSDSVTIGGNVNTFTNNQLLIYDTGLPETGWTPDTSSHSQITIATSDTTAGVYIGVSDGAGSSGAFSVEFANTGTDDVAAIALYSPSHSTYPYGVAFQNSGYGVWLETSYGRFHPYGGTTQIQFDSPVTFNPNLGNYDVVFWGDLTEVAGLDAGEDQWYFKTGIQIYGSSSGLATGASYGLLTRGTTGDYADHIFYTQWAKSQRILTGWMSPTLAYLEPYDPDWYLRLHQFIEIEELATTEVPGTPGSGYGRLYVKDDGKIYFKNDTPVEYDLTQSGGLWSSATGGLLYPATISDVVLIGTTAVENQALLTMEGAYTDVTGGAYSWAEVVLKDDEDSVGEMHWHVGRYDTTQWIGGLSMNLEFDPDTITWSRINSSYGGSLQQYWITASSTQLMWYLMNDLGDWWNAIQALYPDGTGSVPELVVNINHLDADFIVNADLGKILRVDGSTGQVIVGTGASGVAPTGGSIDDSQDRLWIHQEDDYAGLAISSIRDDTGGLPVASITGYAARGTTASPTATQSGDYLLVLGARGYGTQWQTTSAFMLFKATENYTAGAQGADITFELKPTGSGTRVETLYMSGTQVVINGDSGNMDFIVNGDSGEVFRVDAGLDVAQIATWLEMAEVTGPTTGEPGTGFGAIFAKSDGKIYYKNDGGTTYDLTATGGSGEWTESGGFLTQSTSTDIVQLQNWLEIEDLSTGNLPATGEPGTGFGAIFAKASDGKLYYKNDAGTTYDLTQGGASGYWTRNTSGYIYPSTTSDYLLINTNSTTGTNDTFNLFMQTVDYSGTGVLGVDMTGIAMGDINATGQPLATLQYLDYNTAGAWAADFLILGVNLFYNEATDDWAQTDTSQEGLYFEMFTRMDTTVSYMEFGYVVENTPSNLIPWITLDSTAGFQFNNDGEAHLDFKVSGDTKTVLFIDSGTDLAYIGATSIDTTDKNLNVIDSIMIQGLAAGAAGSIGLNMYNERAYQDTSDPGGRYLFGVRDTGEFYIYSLGTAGGGADGDVVRVTANTSIEINQGTKNIDTIIYGDVGEVFRVDAGLEVAQIATWLEFAELGTGATPTTGEPGTGFGAVYVKSDSKLYFKDDGGTEYDLTAGGGGEWTRDTGGFVYLTTDVAGDDVYIGGDGTTGSTPDIRLKAEGGAIFNQNQASAQDLEYYDYYGSYGLRVDGGGYGISVKTTGQYAAITVADAPYKTYVVYIDGSFPNALNNPATATALGITAYWNNASYKPVSAVKGIDMGYGAYTSAQAGTYSGMYGINIKGYAAAPTGSSTGALIDIFLDTPYIGATHTTTDYYKLYLKQAAYPNITGSFYAIYSERGTVHLNVLGDANADFIVEADSVDAIYVDSSTNRVQIKNWLELPEIATPSTGNPASGWGAFYVKSDNLPYFKNDAGAEYSLTSSGGEWTDSSGLYPSDSGGAQNVWIGATTIGSADIALYATGAVEINKQRAATSGIFSVYGYTTGFGIAYDQSFFEMETSSSAIGIAARLSNYNDSATTNDGVELAFYMDDASTARAAYQMAGIQAVWTDHTDSVESSKLVIRLSENGNRYVYPFQFLGDPMAFQIQDTVLSTGDGPAYGYGWLYVKQSDQKLYYRDYLDNDYNLTAGGIWADGGAYVYVASGDYISTSSGNLDLRGASGFVSIASGQHFASNTFEYYQGNSQWIHSYYVDNLATSPVKTAFHQVVYGNTDRTDGGEDAYVTYKLMVNGTFMPYFYVSGGNARLEFNDDKLDFDFVWWGDTVEVMRLNAGLDNVQISTWLELKELAASPGTGEPGTGWGAIYVKTDNKLYFQNDGGTEYDLTSGGGSSILEVQVFS